MAGKIYARRGDETIAKRMFDDALYDVRELQLPEGVSAIVADRGRLAVNPTEFQALLDDLEEFEDTVGAKIFPHWLSGLQKTVTEAKKLLWSKDGISAAADHLRKVGNGDLFMPAVS